MATTIWLGVTGVQDLQTTVSFIMKPHNFPNFLRSQINYLPVIFFHVMVYFVAPAIAGMLATRTAFEIAEDIEYHKDLLSSRSKN
jgi:hypothetical protein